ncbi:MAG: glycerol kinase, partial [Candidatus Omnitrophota bacterium]
QADILGINVVRPKYIETTVLGAAYLAGLGAGYWKNAGEIEKFWEKDRVFRPRMAPEKVSALYGGWRDAVKRTLSGYGALKKK